eukprot:TRINITY_DN7713_c0_g3_i1.p4 TRINITY_DN7713_c0_g3~~TRINITY_DN7713_c0_g3_i1.p4  ORF type:complete len:151 (-),score=0.74 TRINITY_DN7713_c0_g3_i1:60-485(-)
MLDTELHLKSFSIYFCAGSVHIFGLKVDNQSTKLDQQIYSKYINQSVVYVFVNGWQILWKWGGLCCLCCTIFDFVICYKQIYMNMLYVSSGQKQIINRQNQINRFILNIQIRAQCMCLLTVGRFCGSGVGYAVYVVLSLIL